MRSQLEFEHFCSELHFFPVSVIQQIAVVMQNGEMNKVNDHCSSLSVSLSITPTHSVLLLLTHGRSIFRMQVIEGCGACAFPNDVISALDFSLRNFCAAKECRTAEVRYLFIRISLWGICNLEKLSFGILLYENNDSKQCVSQKSNSNVV